MDFLEYIAEYKNTSNNLGEEKCNFKYLNSTFNASLLISDYVTESIKNVCLPN